MSDRKSSGSGCFSAVLRRILCSGSPQTHPSDHIVELNNVDDDHVAAAKAQDSVTGPGIVARLMGLDSLPAENNGVDRKGTKTTGSVTRSRSVSFVDYMLEFDSTQAKHRRVRTSVSFREVPDGSKLFQHNQKQELLVVYLDNVNKNNEASGMFKQRKFEKGDGSSSTTSNRVKQKENVREKVACKKGNQEKNKKISKLKNEPRTRRVSSGKQALNVQINNHGANLKSKAKGPLKIVNQKEVSVLTRKKKNQLEHKKLVDYFEKNSVGSSSSSSSSPVSVLSVNDFGTHQENDIISEESRSILELIKSEKKCSSKSVKHDQSPIEGLGKQEVRKKNFESTKIEESEYYYMELVGKPSQLTEEEIKYTKWITKKVDFKFEDFEEICGEFGEQILNLMLYQVTDELVGFHM